MDIQHGENCSCKDCDISTKREHRENCKCFYCTEQEKNEEWQKEAEEVKEAPPFIDHFIEKGMPEICEDIKEADKRDARLDKFLRRESKPKSKSEHFETGKRETLEFLKQMAEVEKEFPTPDKEPELAFEDAPNVQDINLRQAREDGKGGDNPRTGMIYDWLKLSGVCEDAPTMEEYEASKIDFINQEIIKEINSRFPALNAEWGGSFCSQTLQISKTDTCINEFVLLSIFESLKMLLSEDEAAKLTIDLAVKRICNLFD